MPNNSGSPPDLVSVVVPCYDYARFVPDCMASVVAQTHPAIEVLFFDDGSDDGSREVAESVLDGAGDRFARVIVDGWRGNRGQHAALNAILPEVRGKWVMVLDPDDMLEAGYVESLLRALTGYHAVPKERLSFAYSDATLVDEGGTVLGSSRAGEFDPVRLKTKSYIPGCALTETRSLLSAMPFDEGIRTGTKHHRWQRLVERGSVGVHLAEPLFRYRLHASNLSGIGERIRGSCLSRDGFVELEDYWPVAGG